ncbi:MAG: sensor domain-containing diguanylate cyclase [Gammaproteobacteria bacterium]|nr:sensor domain-containing diguanylate cyclase [Gammaproteobacteria bacterium]MDH5778779.1 sensor domain-containing diguanylate cyclase [Gammaproteobacteria bacterium]
MSADLHSENIQLKRQLRAYLREAKENEKKFLRFHNITLQLLEAPDLPTVIDIIFNQYRESAQLDVLTLTLIDKKYDIRRTLANAGVDYNSMPGLIFVNKSKDLNKLLAGKTTPQLDLFHKDQDDFFFPDEQQKPASVAILPLMRNKKRVGTLNLGSFADNRFVQGAATDFFQQFSSVLTICLENALNKERIKQIGLIDPLTTIHNRRYFDQRMLEEVDRADRNDKPLSCLFIDIDHFKKFNDQYGHQIGDRVLQEVARIIKSQMRASDVLARYGGEEFSILLTNTDQQLAENIAERIRFSISEHTHQLSETVSSHITISIGCDTVHPQGDLSAAEVGAALVHNADTALYQAKEQGRNRVVSFTDSKAPMDNQRIKELDAV